MLVWPLLAIKLEEERTPVIGKAKCAGEGVPGTVETTLGGHINNTLSNITLESQ